MDSDYEPSDSDTEFNPTPNNRGRRQSQSDEYQLPHALRPPRTTTISTGSLHRSMTNGNIELNPEYVTIVLEYVFY